MPSFPPKLQTSNQFSVLAADLSPASAHNSEPEERHYRFFKPKAAHSNDEEQIVQPSNEVHKKHQTQPEPVSVGNFDDVDVDLAEDQNIFLKCKRKPRKRNIDYARVFRNIYGEENRYVIRKQFDRRNGPSRVRRIKRKGAGLYNWGQDTGGKVDSEVSDFKDNYRQYSSTTVGESTKASLRTSSNDTLEVSSKSSNTELPPETTENVSLINKGFKQIQQFLGF